MVTQSVKYRMRCSLFAALVRLFLQCLFSPPQAVQLIAKMVKAKSYNTKQVVSIWARPMSRVLKQCNIPSQCPLSLQVLRTFLHLRLHDVDRPVSATSEQGSRGAKTRREKRSEAKQKLTKKQKRVSLGWSGLLARSLVYTLL